MFEVMHGEQQPAARKAPTRRRQSRFPEAILERPPLDATCLGDLLHAEGILRMLQAIPECWQESRRDATPQFLENPLADGWPMRVRHDSSQRRGEVRGAGWSLHVGSLRHVCAYWQAHRDPGHPDCANCPLTLRVWNSTQAVILSRVTAYARPSMGPGGAGSGAACVIGAGSGPCEPQSPALL